MKARNKKTGQIVEFNKIDTQFKQFEYIEVPKDLKPFGIRKTYSKKEFNELYEIVEDKQKYLVIQNNACVDVFVEDPNHQYGGMKKTWQEEYKELFYKKVSNVDSERDIILDFITTLLEKQREEYVEIVEEYAKGYGISQYNKEEIINLIKSHDK